MRATSVADGCCSSASTAQVAEALDPLHVRWRLALIDGELARGRTPASCPQA